MRGAEQAASQPWKVQHVWQALADEPRGLIRRFTDCEK
jgi:hypothetical protein